MESLPIACNLTLLSATERGRRAELASLLRSRVVSVRELDDGYALVLSLDRAAVSELIALEGRCCPFLRFHLGAAGERGPVELEITGGEGVKAFLAAEFGIPARE